MIRVGKQLSLFFPQRGQTGYGCRKEMDAQRILVDCDLELLETLPDSLGAHLEAPEPIVGIDLPDEIRGWTGYQLVSVVRMVEEPTRRDDVAPDDQRHGGVQ